VIADAANLAQFREHFLHLVEVFLSRLAFEHANHLINDLSLTLWPRQQLVKHRLVSLHTGFQMLKAFFSAVQDGLDED